MMKPNKKLTEQRDVNESLLVFFDLVTLLYSTPRLFIDFFHMAGYDLGKADKPGQMGATTLDKAYAVALETRNLYESIRENLPDDRTSWEAFKKGMEFGKQVIESYCRIKDVFELAGSETGLDIDWEAFLLHLTEQLVLRSHQQLIPAAVQTYILLNWVHPPREPDLSQPETDTSGMVIRYPYRGIRVNKEGINAFIDNPLQALRDVYFPSGQQRNVGVIILEEDKLLSRLHEWLQSLHPKINSVYGYRELDWLDLDEAQRQAFAKTLSLWFPLGRGIEVGISLRRIVRADGRPAIEVAPSLYFANKPGRPSGQDLQNQDFNTDSGWHWNIALNGALNAFTFGPGGIDLPDTPGSLNLQISGGLGSADAAETQAPAYRLGPEECTRLEIGNFAFSVSLHLDANQKEATFELKISNCGLFLMPGDGDSFLSKILPKDGIYNTFDLTVGYSNAREFYVEGGVGGEIVIPVNKKLGEVITIPELQLGFQKLSDSRKWMLYASLSGKVKLGPVSANLDKTGIRLLLSKAEKGQIANLGIFDANLDFKHPSGIGIEVEAKSVTGGGYLYCDPNRGEYIGVAQLNVREKINLKAVGIILTKLPGGKKGYSFLLMITAEFQPIQLGLGFSLAGVGGLAGIHRGLDHEKLFTGLRENTMDDILFPANPLENPYGLVAKINTVFPVAQGQYTFGLLGLFYWGPKDLVTIKLGLIIELPVFRVAIMGVLKAEKSEPVEGGEEGETKSLIRVMVNFAGLFDFEKKFIRFDAALYDSHIMGLKLEGDMALRIRYGQNPDFLITVGGFHPNFQPPELELPADLRRLGVTLYSGNPNISMECYLAITSNTFQFGAAAYLTYESSGVSVRGELSFDAMFQFSPFQFEVGIYFLMSASWRGQEFAAIEVAGLLSGPAPWHIYGKLRLSLWGLSVELELDKTWGAKGKGRIGSVKVMPLLTDDLETPGNWEARAGSTRLWISARRRQPAAANGKLALHPNELLTVRQNTVPLGLRLDKFSERKLKGPSKFRVELAGAGGETLQSTPVKNHFAPAQFFKRSDEEKIAAASYELFQSGAGFDGLDAVRLDAWTSLDVSYESKIIDDPALPPQPQGEPQKENQADFNHGLRNNAVANSAGGRRDRFKTAVASAVIGEQYVVARQENLRIHENFVAASEAEAQQMLKNFLKQNPHERGRLIVLPMSEASV